LEIKILMETVYDILGQELQIGDYIVIPATQGYSVLAIAKILRFTPKTVRIEYITGRNAVWNAESNIEKVHNKYVKVDEALVTFGMLRNN